MKKKHTQIIGLWKERLFICFNSNDLYFVGVQFRGDHKLMTFLHVGFIWHFNLFYSNCIFKLFVFLEATEHIFTKLRFHMWIHCHRHKRRDKQTKSFSIKNA